MDCKNCKTHIENSAQYCSNCGGKVVLERLTLKQLWSSFAINFFGLDNKYLKTAKDLTLHPERVLQGYLDGIRKKYATPFAFLAIGTMLSMLVFSQFSDEYVEMSNSFNEQQFDLINKQLGEEENQESLNELKREQLESNTNTQKAVLTYFNFLTFLLLPLYALIAFWVFGKPYNYAEHLIIACYLQGFTFLFGIVFFLLSIYVHPILYGVSFLLAIAYYLYAYRRLCGYSFGTLFIKLFKFIGITVGVFSSLILAGFLFGYLTN